MAHNASFLSLNVAQFNILILFTGPQLMKTNSKKTAALKVDFWGTCLKKSRQLKRMPIPKLKINKILED